MTRSQALVVRGFAGWTLFVWAVFIRNVVIGGDSSTGARVVHGALAVTSIVLAVASLKVVRDAARG